MENTHTSEAALAAAITKAASKQTYYTVRFLVDRNMVDDAYRAYGYFRWVDDRLDQGTLPETERLAFVQRQQALMDSAYRGLPLADLCPEEHLLVDLIEGDREKDSGLQAYVRNMMAVMAFDARRRWQVVSQRELDEYTRWLAVAVTEALHYFIGRNSRSPHDERRYQAAAGAHIAHMLRDAVDDARAGYYNIPAEIVAGVRAGGRGSGAEGQGRGEGEQVWGEIAIRGVAPEEMESTVYREWVKEQAGKARACFQAGREYLAEVESLRCRIAGYAYIRRFEVVLDSIEREGYALRAEYPERKSARSGLEMIGGVLWSALRRGGRGSGLRGQGLGTRAARALPAGRESL